MGARRYSLRAQSRLRQRIRRILATIHEGERLLRRPGFRLSGASTLHFTGILILELESASDLECPGASGTEHLPGAAGWLHKREALRRLHLIKS